MAHFFIKAFIGGSIRVNLVDLSGNVVDPDTAFPGRDITINVDLNNYGLCSGGSIFSSSLKNGQFERRGLFPDDSWEMDSI